MGIDLESSSRELWCLLPAVPVLLLLSLPRHPPPPPPSSASSHSRFPGLSLLTGCRGLSLVTQVFQNLASANICQQISTALHIIFYPEQSMPVGITRLTVSVSRLVVIKEINIQDFFLSRGNRLGSGQESIVIKLINQQRLFLCG